MLLPCVQRDYEEKPVKHRLTRQSPSSVPKYGRNKISAGGYLSWRASHQETRVAGIFSVSLQTVEISETGRKLAGYLETFLASESRKQPNASNQLECYQSPICIYCLKK